MVVACVMVDSVVVNCVMLDYVVVALRTCRFDLCGGGLENLCNGGLHARGFCGDG